MLSQESISILLLVMTATLFSPLIHADRNTDINKLFNLAENAYPQHFSPSPAETQTLDQWAYRYYAGSDTYAGVNTEDQVYVVGGNFGIEPIHVGQLDALLNQECSQRIGPFVTQTTAWQRWREAKSQGYSTSNGVVPCYESYTRGYCFFVYYQC